MRTTIIHSETAQAAFESWINAHRRRGADKPPSVSLQALRQRIEAVFGPMHSGDAETMMRTPNALLAGETPWEVLYHSPGGPDRLENILDLVERGRLDALPVSPAYKLPERRSV